MEVKVAHRVTAKDTGGVLYRGLKVEMLATVGLALLLFLAIRCTTGRTETTISSIQHMAWQGDRYLWTCGPNAIAQYDVHTGSIAMYNYNCGSILVDNEGAVWITSGTDVGMYSGGIWQTFDHEDGLVEGWYDYGVLLEASDGAIWVGNSGLSRYDPSTKEWRTLISPLPHVPSSSSSESIEVYIGGVDAVLQSSDGAVWAASTQGVIRLDGTFQQTWTAEDGLADNIVRALLETQDGAIWVGTDQGISRWDGSTWQTLPYASEPDTDGYHITEILLEKSDGTIWATTWEGVACWDGSDWQTWPIARGLPHHEGIRALLETRDGTLWAGTWGGGVSRWDGRDWRSYTVADGLSDNRIQALLESPNGTLWAGTFNGVNYYDPNVDQWRYLPKFSDHR